MGNIGTEISKRAKAFEMRVIAYDPLVDEEIFHKAHAEKVDLDELLSNGDFLSLHCGLNDKTRNILNEESFLKMKKGVLLINTATG